MTQFWITVIGTAIVITAAMIIEPYVKEWNRRRRGSIRKELKRDQELGEKWRRMVWRPENESQRRERDEVLEVLRSRIVVSIVLISAIALLFALGSDYVAKSFEGTEEKLQASIAENIALFDSVAIRLWQKTTTTLEEPSVCEGNEEEVRVRAELTCLESAYIRSQAESHEQVVREYRLCMVDNGWRTRPCGCDDDSEKCIDLLSTSKGCKLTRWKAVGTYLGAECTSYVPQDVRRVMTESECIQKAYLFSEQKWYEGFSDFDRLQSTIATYSVCMREKGWSTVDCPADQIGSKECREIPFVESMCQTSTRQWLAGERSRRPCVDARSWLDKRRAEPEGRQW